MNYFTPRRLQPPLVRPPVIIEEPVPEYKPRKIAEPKIEPVSDPNAIQPKSLFRRAR